MKGTKIEYLIVILLVCISGNQALDVFYGQTEPTLVAMAGFLTVLFLRQKRRHFTPRFCFVSLFFTAILVGQSVFFFFFPIATIIGFLIRVYIGYVAVRLVRDFPRVYINVLCGIGVMSLCFFLPHQAAKALGIDFPSFFVPLRILAPWTHHFHIFVHDFSYLQRNSSFFWEPGALGGYSNLALIFLAFARGEFTERAYRIRLAVLVACALTTFSTTSYVVLPLALLLHFRFRRQRFAAAFIPNLVNVFLLCVLVALAYRAVRLEFVGPKIRDHYEMSITRSHGWEVSRIGTALFDWEYIKRRPFFGWGLATKTRYMMHPFDAPTGQGNGMTDFTAKFGFVGMCVFLLCVSRGVYLISGAGPVRSAYAAALVLLILNGEGFLNYPLFLGLMFFDKVAPSRNSRGLPVRPPDSQPSARENADLEPSFART